MILVDTREQKPFWKPGQNVQRATLSVGDYTTVKLRNRLHIERKSLSDLYGTLTKGHVRFKKMLIRAKISGTQIIVVVEGSRKKFLAKNFSYGDKLKFPAEGFVKMLRTMKERHGLDLRFCPSRSKAKKLTAKLLNI